MPYKIELEFYCDNCPEFEVFVKEDAIYYQDFLGEDKKVIDRTVVCKHRKRCENLSKYLLKKLEKENKQCQEKIS